MGASENRPLDIRSSKTKDSFQKRNKINIFSEVSKK